MMDTYIRPADSCVMCGAPVPEGRQVCWECEQDLKEEKGGDPIGT